ncbi:MAG TPA: hypothetical protein VHW01_16210 [Polyangiaceae bacterium]|jgi:hypothetical protein|nr:hypothetical protein [Polyangiaceae bacterium]
MYLSRTLICCSLALSLLVSRSAQADAIDPSAARELLKQGYALKQHGKFAEALPRLTESLRLDSQLKTLINVADCEESLGMLSQAQKHWVAARDQATTENAQTFLAEAEKRLTALEARMPRLTVNRTGPVVEGMEIRRDGVLLEGPSLGTPLPTDAGKHEVVVTAPGHAEARFSIELVEKDSKVLNVTAGVAEAPRPRQPASLASPAAATPMAAPAADETSQISYWNAQRAIAVGAVGLGIVGLGVGGYSWAHANSQHKEALTTCNPDCDDAARQKQASAVSSAHLSSAMLITGGVLVAGGAVLWLTAPSSASTRLGVVPVASPSEAGLVAVGSF